MPVGQYLGCADKLPKAWPDLVIHPELTYNMPSVASSMLLHSLHGSKQFLLHFSIVSCKFSGVDRIWLNLPCCILKFCTCQLNLTPNHFIGVWLKMGFKGIFINQHQLHWLINNVSHWKTTSFFTVCNTKHPTAHHQHSE